MSVAIEAIPTLTDAEIAGFRRDGYLVPRWRFPAAQVEDMREAAEGLVTANPDHRPEQLVCPHIEGGATKPMRNERHADFLKLGTSDGLLAMLRQLLGDNVLMWGSQLFCKLAGIGMEVPWHQDGDYWPIRPLATVSAWIALDASTVENGCLRVIPGSHTDGAQPHVIDGRSDLALDQTVAPAHLPLERAVDVVLEPGQLVLFDAWLMHGSNANTSGARRAGIVYRFMPSSSLMDRGIGDKQHTDGHKVGFVTRPLYQVIGEDAGANTLVREVG
jgi:ectoine hydroxylase-related dioxygenase (phytanoyl-CoA dioxygenase family)